jgi:hypothetical protein
MPRTKDSKNSSYYHYIVHDLDDNDSIISSKYMKTQKDIQTEYNINRSAVYYLINPVESRVPRIKHKIAIEKCMVPIYQTTYISPNISSVPTIEIEVS